MGLCFFRSSRAACYTDISSVVCRESPPQSPGSPPLGLGGFQTRFITFRTRGPHRVGVLRRRRSTEAPLGHLGRHESSENENAEAVLSPVGRIRGKDRSIRGPAGPALRALTSVDSLCAKMMRLDRDRSSTSVSRAEVRLEHCRLSAYAARTPGWCALIPGPLVERTCP